MDWTPELHRRFVQAVEQLGVDKAVPSRILDLMGIDCLTRHNIASHLQVCINRVRFYFRFATCAGTLLYTISEIRFHNIDSYICLIIIQNFEVGSLFRTSVLVLTDLSSSIVHYHILLFAFPEMNFVLKKY